MQIIKHIWPVILLLAGMIVNTGCSERDSNQDSPAPGDRETLVRSADDTDALAGFPLYPGTEQLSAPVTFEWKNLNAAYNIPYSQWAYYSAYASYKEVAAFYKNKSIAPPFTNISLFWKETDNGTLGAWFQEASANKYTRIWFIPNPDDDRKSYLIIMRNNDISSCAVL